MMWQRMITRTVSFLLMCKEISRQLKLFCLVWQNFFLLPPKWSPEALRLKATRYQKVLILWNNVWNNFSLISWSGSEFRTLFGVWNYLLIGIYWEILCFRTLIIDKKVRDFSSKISQLKFLKLRNVIFYTPLDFKKATCWIVIFRIYLLSVMEWFFLL